MLLKTVALALGLAAASTSYGYTNLAGKQFTGNGHWIKPTGEQGTYSVTTTIANTRVAKHQAMNITSAYNFGERKMTTTLTAVFNQKNGYHDMMVTTRNADDDKQTLTKVGTGYCIHDVCHYNAVIDGIAIEETITVVRNQMHKIGSKSITKDDGTIRVSAWDENLRARILQPRP